MGGRGLLLIGALALASCGGGGEGSSPFDPPAPGPPKTTVAGGTTPSATETPAQGGTPIPEAPEVSAVRFFPIPITDPMSGGITAFTFLAPQGWNYSGSVNWMPEWRHLAFLQTTVSDPASGVVVDYLPLTDFIWFDAPPGLEAPIGGNYQGKAYVPPITDPVEFVVQMWMPGPLAHLGGASVQSVVEVPAAAEQLLALAPSTAEAHGYKIRYTYDQNGQPWEQDVSFVLLYLESPDLTQWYVNLAHTESGPAGELDRQAGVIGTIIASWAATPEWQANYEIVGQLFTQGIQQQMADTVAFGQLLAQYRAESAARQAQVVADRQASQDRNAEWFGQVLLGVDTYVNPSSGTLVQLPSTWSNYWVNDRGEYLVVDQPGFDPNTLNDGSWQQLQPR